MRKTKIRPLSKKRQKELRLERELWVELFKEQEGLCKKCLKPPDFRGLSLSHKKRKSQGGQTTRENCELLCGKCHAVEEHHLREVKSEPMWGK